MKLMSLRRALCYQIKTDAKLYAVACPCRIPTPLKNKVKQELDKTVQDKIIAPVKGPIDWCAPVVVVPKKNGAIRLCVHYIQLNKYVKKERILLPSVDEFHWRR